MQTNKKNSLLPVLAVVAVVGIASFVVLRSRTPKGPAIRVYTGVDTSDSVRQPLAAGGTLRGRFIAQMTRLAMRLEAGHDRLTFFRVDSEVREFSDETAPRSRQKFQWKLIHATDAPATKPGTFPAKFFRLTAERATEDKCAVAVVYYGDGDSDDLSPATQHEMRRAALQLASNPRVVSVAIYGVTDKNWEQLREWFAPLGDRLQLHGVDEMDAAPLLEKLEVARHQELVAPDAATPSQTRLVER